MPALLKSTSSLPNSATVNWTALRQSASWVTSRWTYRAESPSSSASAWPSSSSRSPMTTFAPSATSIRALAPPMLRAPPLIRATLPSTRPMRGKIAPPTRTSSRNETRMTIRVAQVGTGNAGRLTLRQLIADDRFELVAVSTSTPEKVGTDAGELAGVDAVTGVAAVGDLDALIAAGPECVVYCAMGDTRPREATNDVRKLLEAGIDVVGSAPGTLQFPWGTMPQPVIDKVEAAARAGGASLYITGVDPGFASDLVPLALASTCQRIVQIWEAEPAPESYDIAAGRIEKGTIAALHFSISGMVDGHPAIVVEHVTRTRDDLRPDWASPANGGGAYRVEIVGEPSYVVDIVPSSEHGDHNHAAIVGACGRIVNSIPDVRAAAPGIRTTLDLPLPTGRGTYVAP